MITYTSLRTTNHILI